MTEDSVRALFPQLLANGYVPLPNKDKACLLRRWPTVEVNEAQVQKWSRGTRWKAIGLRVEPPLLVMDYDLPGREIAHAVRAVTPASVLAGLERIGKPPKTAFFLRLRLDGDDDPFRKMATRRYRRDGIGEPFAVEAFGGGAPHPQMGAFGPHSHDEFGAVKATYAWVDGRSPANVRIHDLPEISRAEVNEALGAAEAVLAGWPGMAVDKLVNDHTGGFQTVHDLTSGTVFQDIEGEVYSLEELTEEARSLHRLKRPQLRITGSFTGDPMSSGSARAKVSWSPRTGLAVVDFKTGLTHRPILILDEPETQELLDKIFNTKGSGGHLR